VLYILKSVFKEGSSFRPTPRLGVRFIADSNSWNVNGRRQNCQADAQSTEAAGVWQCSCTTKRTFFGWVIQNQISGIGIGRGGRFALPGIWILQQKRVVFLVSRGKKRISLILTPVQKFWKKPQVALPWKKFFRHPVFQVGHQMLYFDVYGNMVEESRMCQQQQKIFKGKVCRMKVFRLRANLGNLGKNILCTLQKLPAPALMALN